MLEEQRVYATHNSGAEKTALSIFVPIRREMDEEEKIWGAKV